MQLSVDPIKTNKPTAKERNNYKAKSNKSNSLINAKIILKSLQKTITIIPKLLEEKEKKKRKNE